MNGTLDDGLAAFEQDRLLAAECADAVASIKAGLPFSVLLAADDGERRAALEALMREVASSRFRFAGATNPLRAPLTLERLLIQVLPGRADLLHQSPGVVIRQIAERRGEESCVLLVIERAETLHPDLLRFFREAVPWFAEDVPVLQVLFVGRPEFRRFLLEAGGGVETGAVLPGSGEEPVAAPAEAAVPAAEAGGLQSEFGAMWRHGVVARLLLVLGPLVVLAAVVVGVVIAVSPGHDVVQPVAVPPLAQMPPPGQVDPGPAILQPGPPADEATADLRREFEAYLAALGKHFDDVPDVQKRAAYDEFLVWRARTTGAPPPLH